MLDDCGAILRATEALLNEMFPFIRFFSASADNSRVIIRTFMWLIVGGVHLRDSKILCLNGCKRLELHNEHYKALMVSGFFKINVVHDAYSFS